ncbi:MAG: serine protease [Gammaproteobacteria bacterium]|nr:serine protease [Gammaproteobacteria bacterium]
MKKWLKIVIFAISALSVSLAIHAQSIDAEYLYKSLKSSIYQIQVIDIASDKKSSIGSGFMISEEGLIATNYHVISDFINSPEKYRIEYLAHDGQRGELILKDIDIIHDLAIVYGKMPATRALTLSPKSLFKGAHIYSLGNPRDLGMTIIEGTYNGLLEKSLYEKILFSGALNPGMSGGPALDNRGHVIGINVSTAGNDLSFLVPVRYLSALLRNLKESAEPVNFEERIEQQLFNNQSVYMQSLLEKKWASMTLGDVELPAELDDYFKCWGKTDDDKDQLYIHTYSACSSPDSIYISSEFNTGTVDFRYDWFDADKLNSFQFYSRYTREFEDSFSTNRATKDDVSNYKCNSGFVSLHNKSWKVALCARNYKKFNSLYDLSLTMAQVSEYDRGMIINLNATGIARDVLMKFARQFMENIRWQN